MSASVEPIWNVDKLSYEIFSILESKFLFSPSPPATPAKPAAAGGGKVRILSIDAAGDGTLAAACLSRLESSLRNRASKPTARISDFFDVVAGSGAGGVLAALLFTRRPDGGPPFSADEALRLLIKHRRGKSGVIRRMLGFRQGGGRFRRVFGEATLKDAVKPVLVPCYDLRTGAAFMFSRADAVEGEGFDFRVRDVVAATRAKGRVVEVESVDGGKTRIEAVGGAVAMGNPAAAAVTHVLNNGKEFPVAKGVEDVFVVSIGGEEGGNGRRSNGGVTAPSPSPAELVEIAGKGDADLVDQALAMAFGHCRTNNYVRIQANGLSPLSTHKSKSSKDEAMKVMEITEEVLAQRNMESVLFRGKKLSEQTNAEKLEWVSDELIKEHERRAKSNIPVVILKQPATPRTSSATTRTSIATTTTSSTTSTSL